MTQPVQNITELKKSIRLLILDVDGVLTDGTLAYTESGELVKNFNAKDGFGIRMLLEHNIEVAVITARNSPPLARRMKDLKIANYYTGCDNKVTAFEDLLQKLDISADQTGYVGDDILDLPVMRRVALPIAVGDAHPVARKNALWVTEYAGGRGAVREVCDGLISARTDLENAYNDFLTNNVGNVRMDKV